MRVTQNMISHNMLKNLSTSYKELDKYLNQLSTGRKINRPSDDPFITIKGHNYRTQVKQYEQYERNIGEVHNWMDNTDVSLHNATDTLKRIRELTIQASNDTYTAEERESIQKEVKQLKEELIDIANTKVNDKYIFNGANTRVKPIEKTEDGLQFAFVSEEGKDFKIDIGNGTEINVNVFGGDLFGEDLLGDNGVIDKLIEELGKDQEETSSEEISSLLEDLDKQINEVISARADLGARMNRVDLIENRIEKQTITVKDMMSKNENVDFEEAIINMITQETLHRAALSAGTRIIQPTLMDFLS